MFAIVSRRASRALLVPVLLGYWLLMSCVIAATPHSGINYADPSLPQTRRRVTLEEVIALDVPSISSLKWLAEGTILAEYKTSRLADAAKHTWKLSRGGPVEISVEGASGDDQRGVSIQDKVAISYVDRHGKAHTLRIPRSAHSVSAGEVSSAWSADGQRVAFAEETSVQEADSTVDGSKQAVEVGEHLLHTSIWIVTIVDVLHPTSLRRTQLSGNLLSIDWGSGKWSKVVFCTYYEMSRDRTVTKVESIDARTADAKVLFTVGGLQQSVLPRISPNGRWLALRCDVDSQRSDDFTSLIIVDLRTGQRRRLTESYAVGAIEWSPKSDAIYFNSRDGSWVQIHKVDLAGSIRLLTSTRTQKSALRISPDGNRVAYVSRDGYGLLDIHVLDLASDRDVVLVTLSDPRAQLAMGEFKEIRFPAEGGIEVAGFLVFPPDFDPSVRYPVLVDVHGGGPGSPLALIAPLTALIAPGPLEWHAWAAMGYLVFVPDYRSSGEYGKGIAAKRYETGDYNGIDEDAKDIESGVVWLLKNAYVDRDRLAIMGTSAGGARVNLLLTRSSLFRAGILFEPTGSGPLADLLASTTGDSAGDPSWQDFFVTALGQSLAGRPDLYQRSFLLDGYKSHTPTLILVGESVARGAADPMSAEVLFSILRQYRVPTRMLRYTGEGHGLGHAESARHAFAECLSWVDKYLDIHHRAEGDNAYGNRGAMEGQ